MAHNDSDYMRQPVPQQRTIAGWKLAVVIAGIGVTLPILFLGADVALAVGFWRAHTIFWLGCLLPSLLGCLTAVVGARTRLSTYRLLEFPFGRLGGKLVNSIMTVTLLGWYAATLDIFAGLLTGIIRELCGWPLPEESVLVIGSVLMTLTAVFGLRIIEKFSLLTVPLLMALLLYVCVMALPDFEATVPTAGDGGKQLASVIGAFILTAVMMPDLTRFAANGWESVKATGGMAIGFPLILLASAIPALATGERDIMLIMSAMGVAAGALFVLIFATWTTNTVNIYSAALSLSTLFTRMREWKLTVAGSLVGTLLALLGFMDYFSTFLIFLGITAAPVAGIYLVDYFILNRMNYDLDELNEGINPAAMFSWLAACALAFCSEWGLFSLTSLSAVDSILISSMLYLASAAHGGKLVSRQLPSKRYM